MPKQSKSNFWLDLLSQLVDVFYKSSRKGAGKRTFHQHVVPNDKGWAVKREGNKRVTAVYKYQDQAIRKAKRLAKNIRPMLLSIALMARSGTGWVMIDRPLPIGSTKTI